MAPVPSDDHCVGLFSVWGSNARSAHTLKRLRGVLQAKTNDRDGLVFDLFSYVENNYIRFKMKNSSVPCMSVLWTQVMSNIRYKVNTCWDIFHNNPHMPITNHGNGLC